MHCLMSPLLLACCVAGHAAEPPVAHYGQEAIHLSTGDDANDPGGQLREQVIMRAAADYLGDHPEDALGNRRGNGAARFPPVRGLPALPTRRIHGRSGNRALHRCGVDRGQQCAKVPPSQFRRREAAVPASRHRGVRRHPQAPQELETQGKFSFATPELRAQAHAYWTRDHGASLSTPADEKAAFDPKALFITCEQAPQR